ncbi:MotE family protein [Maricaulis maris]|uniref:MotE family protein n=1 Tax=Maricaulis maris TaxID=74318 RepID=UPI003B8B8CDF
MREPLRFLTVLAVLMGGLLGLKTLSIANGAAEWWDAQGSAMAAQASQEAEGGDADSDAPIMPAEHSEPAELEAEPSALEVSAAFAERIASGVRTAEEERVIYRLRERSSELDARERQLETREALMLAMEQRVDTKIVELDALRTQIESLSGELSEREDADMAVIVSWYSAMEPADASDRIATLDMETQLQIASRMSQRTFGAILAEMDTGSAAALTERMASRSNLPETVAELEARIAEGG